MINPNLDEKNAKYLYLKYKKKYIKLKNKFILKGV
jgi:hypothetical protein